MWNKCTPTQVPCAPHLQRRHLLAVGLHAVGKRQPRIPLLALLRHQLGLHRAQLGRQTLSAAAGRRHVPVQLLLPAGGRGEATAAADQGRKR